MIAIVACLFVMQCLGYYIVTENTVSVDRSDLLSKVNVAFQRGDSPQSATSVSWCDSGQ